MKHVYADFNLSTSGDGSCPLNAWNSCADITDVAPGSTVNIAPKRINIPKSKRSGFPSYSGLAKPFSILLDTI